MLKKNFGKILSIFLIVFISSSITYSIISITNIRNDEKYTKLLLASKLNEISVFLKDNSENNNDQSSFTNKFSYKLGELSSLYWNGVNPDENLGPIIAVFESAIKNSNLNNNLSSDELLSLSILFNNLSKDPSDINSSNDIVEFFKK